MPPTELTSTRPPRDPAAEPKAPCARSPHVVAEGRRPGLEALAHPDAAGRRASAQPWANRRRGAAAFHVAALWLRRALADAARTWALAAGVPPDLYD